MPDCPNVLTSGNCTDQQCPNNHNVLRCSSCGERHKRSGGDAYKVALNDAEKDKNGVKVEGDLEFGIVNQQAASRPLEKRLRIWATSATSKVKLVSALLGQAKSHAWRRRLPSFSVTIESESKNISTVDATIILVNFGHKHIGRYEDRVELEFEDQQTKKRFIISRLARAIVGESGLHSQFKPREPYVPRRITGREPETNVVEGVKPPALKAISYVNAMPRPDVPPPLLSILTQSSAASARNIDTIRNRFLPKQLDVQSHGNHFKSLLWVEEHRMEHDLAGYDMTKSTLARHIPTTTWRFLALLKNARAWDRILVRRNEGPPGHWYAGHVHFVRQCEVGLRFHQSFEGWSQEQKYHIRFKLNKIPLWRQHQALDTHFDQPRILFPISSHLPKAPPPQQDIKPPGTGKTMTIVEAIKQLVKNKPNARILAYAPSNAAADLIASRLRDAFNIDELFRLYAPSRHKDQVPDELMPYTYYHELPNSRPCFGAPTMGRMKRFKVIVATCISASIISGIGMPRGHFTHIFVDEAGQATEPEALVPIRMMVDKATNVVLSGDPKQLGPIVRSGIASKLGLELSYLERLMELPSYDLKTCSGKSIVKLVKNYRSHNAILKYPNESFYEGDLQPCANTAITDSYLDSPWLPKGDFPIVFHSVSGKDDREASSPSFFNIDEVIAVKQYVQQLKANREFRTSDQDIGVITPYHAQCQKIRSALRSVADEVKVASVEDFQGQERRVIIISTVRSSKEFISYDIRHTLGFVASPRRFNVSVTRAKALLIVIGDPEVLGLDPLWRSFLNYVYLNKGWKGPEIPWDSTEPVNGDGGYDADIRDAARADMNDFTRRLEAFALEGTEEDMDAGIDRPWRELD
ncbi:hypothetical protein NP233_g5406 [Leucocoprinus birnbaumii]|uniref:RNA helicase n=1 Tax=Leucocoprinus birnbaumii TaxID=56174 RepID=A0AAD5VSY1_9AGAR|nr:hypothetical protein NP233_g5406 [Leucocoprinus birnbaumii]